VNIIAAFDLMEKKLLEIRLPDDYDTIHTSCRLWAFGEFLSRWGYNDGKVEIWVMKEYKVHLFWTKTLVLQLDVIPTRCFPPIWFTKSGDIIGIDGSARLMKYNDKGRCQGITPIITSTLTNMDYKSSCTQSLYFHFLISGDNERV